MIVLSKIKFCTLPVQLIFTDEVMRENGIYFIDLIGNYVLNEKFVKETPKTNTELRPFLEIYDDQNMNDE